MRYKFLLLMVVCSSISLVRADVADSAANGFTIRAATIIHAGPEDVYNRLVHNLGDWWGSDHTVSGDAHNLSLDDKVMGCFCEKLPNNGGVRHAEVIMVMPNKMLVMSGSLGPLQKFGATGTLTLVLEPMHHDTRVQLIYAVGGYLPDGLNTWAAPVNEMWTGQLQRLKRYVETGSAIAPAAATKQ